MGFLDRFRLKTDKELIQQALVEKKFLNTYLPNMVNHYMQSVQRPFNFDQPIFLDDNLRNYIKEGYKSVGAVYECVSLKLNKLAACPILVYEVKDEQGLKKYNNLLSSSAMEHKAQALMMKSRVLEEVTVKDIQDILDRPNPYQDITEITEYLAGSLELTGNHFLYRTGSNPKDKKYSQFFCLPPQETTILAGKELGEIKGYKVSYNPNETLQPEEVIHGKYYNPDYSSTRSHLYGQAPLMAFLRDLTILRDGDKEIAKQLKNGGTFGIVTPKNREDHWGTDQKDDFKNRLIDAKANPDEIARIFPAAVPLEWLQIGLTIADMELVSLIGVKKEDIYRAFHIPLPYLNQDASSYNNKSEAGKELIYNGLDPIAQKISRTYTRAICDPIYERTKKRYIIKVDTSSLPEMAADMKEIAEWLSKSYDLTLNEKREVKGWGKLEGIENMDIPLVPNSWVRVDMAGLDTAAFDKANEQSQNSNA